MSPGLFDPLIINGVRFRNRLLRSSVGGRTCNYDGTVTEVWKNFERRFADGGVAGIISTTFHVNRARLSPPQYPSIAGPEYVPYLRKYIREIREGGCRYIVQIGDPGYAAYSSLFPDRLDHRSSSGGFDFAFGYGNRRRAMSKPEVEKAIRDYADAAGRVQDAGADGLEITATKGYLIHQVLNPAINRRRDRWGGDAQRRFAFLREIIEQVRARVGRGFLVGVRLSGEDLMRRPLLLALGRLSLRAGNDLAQMLAYAGELRTLGVDYLHVVAGYGFPNPRDVPGPFPFDEVKLFFNSVRHLSAKATLRASCVNLFGPIARALLARGWRYEEGANLKLASEFKGLQDEAGMPAIIVNGGFQRREAMEAALASDGCDMISMARALIANPDLPRQYELRHGLARPACSFCNRCVGRTGTSPLGCYDRSRFADEAAMFEQIMAWNRSDPVADAAMAPARHAAAAIARSPG